MTPPASERFGRYVLLAPIAEGGMGEVWRARSEAGLGLGKTVALKRIAPRLCTDAEFVAMFIEEARISLVLGHPNIVNVFDAGREGDQLFLAMEHVDGRNLHDVIGRCLVATGHPLPERHALYVAAEVSRGLEHAHRRRGADGRRLGIVHRDVSPGNILCSYEGDVKLTDFGLAKAAVRAYQSVFGTIKGKAAYMAPEQAAAGPVDGRVDVFGLGAVLYEMLAGKGPYARFEAERDVLEAARRGDVAPLTSLRPDLDASLCAIVDRALAPAPGDRWLTAMAVHDAIARYAAARGMALSAADWAEFLTQLFDVPATTVPPHPFVHALGMGLGLGTSTAPPPSPGGGPTARMQLGATPAVPAAVFAGGEVAKIPEVPSTILVPPPSSRAHRRRRAAIGAVVTAVAAASALLGLMGTNRAIQRGPVVVRAPATTDPLPDDAEPGSASGNRPVTVPSAIEESTLSPEIALVPPRPAPPRKPPWAPAAEGLRPTRGGAISAEGRDPDARPKEVAVVSFGSDPWAEVSVDGVPLCRAPLGCKDRELSPGRRRVRFINPAAGRCKDITVHLVAGLNPPLTVDLEPCR